MPDAEKINGKFSSHYQAEPDESGLDELQAKAIESGVSLQTHSGRWMEAPGGGRMHMTFGRSKSANELQRDLARVELEQRKEQSFFRRAARWLIDLRSWFARK